VRALPIALSTIFFYALMYAFTLLCVPLGILVSYIAPRSVLSACVQFWARTIFTLMGKRLHVQGREWIPASRGYLIVTNHTSLFDIPAIMAIFPQVAWLGREYLIRIPLFGHMLRRMNYIVVDDDPSKSVRKILRQAIAGAQSFTIALFPEGTRTLDGQLQEFKRGFVHIMRAAELDVLPVTLNGLFELKPKNRFRINPFVRLQVIIHKPLSFSELQNVPNEEIVNRVKSILQNGLKEN
jgi:1-acyl-sn-glycerol-3-phosphate acyltransferase